MKFLCENCKAKYQIADDKVAGRTVRMKCRKCNHMIEVEASVTETSVAATNPDEDRRKPGASTGVSGAKGGAVQAAASGLPPPRPAPPPPRPMSNSLPGVRQRTPLPTVAPSSSRPPGGRGTTKTPAPAGGAGLAGAFSKAVSAPHEDPSSVSAAMAVLSSSSSTEEWYVGINGVPVGPVRLSDLRRKAANGLITEESLVWREGFEEWVPLRTFPELAAMLKESATSGRTSLTPTPGLAAPIPAGRAHAPLPRTPASPAGSGIRPSVTPRAVASQSRSNVLAFAARGATAEKIDGLSEPSLEEQVRFDDSVRPPPAASLEPAVAPAAALVTAAPVLPEVFEPVQFHAGGFSTRMQQSRRAHPALWLVVALGGMLLGVGAMVVLLPKSNVKPSVQIVSVMVPAPAAPAAQQPAEGEGNTTIGPIEVSAPITAGKGAGSKGSKAAAEPAAPGAPAAPLSTSLTGLGGLVGGPSAPSGGIAPSGGGGQLQAVDVERVVQSHRAFVKRQCWEPALGARAPNAPSSVRVVVSINVARDGSVPSATTTGGEGFPGLASCVQGQVTKWKFPPSEGSTVNVPFIFAAQ
jgi:predicted Zn finger-like uncharacterized protein